MKFCVATTRTKKSIVPELTYTDFVRMIVDALEEAEIAYLIGGSLAAWAYGEPRTTQDVDIVIQLEKGDAEKLSEALLKREIFVPPDIIIDTAIEWRSDSPLHAIHGHSGYKAEFFFVRSEDEFRNHAFRRRVLTDLGPDIGEVFLHAVEDLILYKLRFYGISKQHKHARDISAILLGTPEVDIQYIERWAAELGVLEEWHEVQSANGELHE